MATDSLMAPLPQLLLEPGAIVRLEAIDATTGLAVAGVKVKAVSIYGTAGAEHDLLELGGGPFMLVPGPGA